MMPFGPLDRPDRWNYEISKIQDGGDRHIEKSQNHHISATVWASSLKNLAWTCSSTPLSVPTVKNLKFRKSKMATADILKNRKLTYLLCGLSDFDKIWHSDAVLLDRSDRWKCKIFKIQDCGCHHLEESKIEISGQWFDRSAHYLAWWRILALRTRRAMHESSYASFCASILRTQIVTCVTQFTKHSYVRKIVNSCVNIRTIWAVQRQKIFVTIASWWSYLDVWF